jgi:hypothetical protein
MATPVLYGRRGGDSRGSSRQRQRRKLWLLSEAAKFGGDGSVVPCYWCHNALIYETLESDRHPIPGHRGGGYVRGNVVPACRRCNAGRYRKHLLTCAQESTTLAGEVNP